MNPLRLTLPEILLELEPTAATNLDRHLKMAKEWMPHDYVPWSQGRDFDIEPYEPGQSTLSEIAQIAFEVNLLTEDNLPSYHREIVEGFGRDGAWGTWVHRWTAEEGR
ncbi:MAG: acyl-ACP desaturase, partial [Actinomycetota bacterium]|nr:acyl-ACP desaturase [Actinomycetota bacterium]